MPHPLGELSFSRYATYYLEGNVHGARKLSIHLLLFEKSCLTILKKLDFHYFLKMYKSEVKTIQANEFLNLVEFV